MKHTKTHPLTPLIIELRQEAMRAAEQENYQRGSDFSGTASLIENAILRTHPEPVTYALNIVKCFCLLTDDRRVTRDDLVAILARWAVSPDLIVALDATRDHV